MPETTDDGGTPEPKTFTQAEVDAIRNEGKAEGQKESHSHFQSIFDKETAKIRADSNKENGELVTSIREMRAANLANLPEAERDSAMIREMYDERNKPAPAAPVSPTPDVPSTVSQGASQQDLQDSINKSLTALGLDASKIDWGDGSDPDKSMTTFTYVVF